MTCSPRFTNPAGPDDLEILATSAERQEKRSDMQVRNEEKRAACSPHPAVLVGPGRRRRHTERPAKPGRQQMTMPAEPPQSPIAEAVRSLEVRWIFPGPLQAAVGRWFGRFPAATEAREDLYLLEPSLRGLSVKIRGGGALEVKAYRGSAGIPGGGRACERAPGVLAEVVVSLPAGARRQGQSTRLAAGAQATADQPVHAGQRAGHGVPRQAGRRTPVRRGTH